MIHKILVAVDNSNNNQMLFDSAIDLAQSADASLSLLHVIPEQEANYPILPTYTYYPDLNEDDYEFYRRKFEEYKRLGIDLLQDFTARAIAAGIECKYSQLIGNPGKTICEQANKQKADLILIGSRGLKGLKEMFLGSVSNYVTHHASCSVMIIRESVDRQLKSSNQSSQLAETSSN